MVTRCIVTKDTDTAVYNVVPTIRLLFRPAQCMAILVLTLSGFTLEHVRDVWLTRSFKLRPTAASLFTKRESAAYLKVVRENIMFV